MLKKKKKTLLQFVFERLKMEVTLRASDINYLQIFIYLNEWHSVWYPIVNLPIKPN